MKLQIHPYFLFSAEYYLMQNIGLAANFSLTLTQLETFMSSSCFI